MNDYFAALTAIFQNQPVTVLDMGYQSPIDDNLLFFHYPTMMFDHEQLDTVRTTLSTLPFKFESDIRLLFIPTDIYDVWKELNPFYCVNGMRSSSDDEVVPSRKWGRVLEWIMESSAALTSDDETALNQLAQLSHFSNIDVMLPPAEQLAQIYDLILPHLPHMSPTPPLERTPFVFPRLLSIYDELTMAIFVVPDDSQVIRETDWAAVSDWFGQQFDRLLVTTETQFKLLSVDMLSVSLTTGNVRHNWGQSLVADGTIIPSTLVGRALDNILKIYTDVLPNAYIAAGNDDAALRKVAHDIMNDLLRITFRHEVLSFDLPETTHSAPEPFNDSKTHQSQNERVLNIYDYIREWVRFYCKLYAELRQDSIAM